MAFVSAQEGGAIIWMSSGDLTVTNSTFVTNSAEKVVCHLVHLISSVGLAFHACPVLSLPPPTSCSTPDLSITTITFGPASLNHTPKLTLLLAALPYPILPPCDLTTPHACKPSIAPLPQSLFKSPPLSHPSHPSMLLRTSSEGHSPSVKAPGRGDIIFPSPLLFRCAH